MEITSDQLRAARSLLRLDQADLARRAGVSVVTVRRLEGAAGSAGVTDATARGVRRVLEGAGVEFIENGVRKRRSEAEIMARYEALRAISQASAAMLQGQAILTDDDLYDENGLPW